MADTPSSQRQFVAISWHTLSAYYSLTFGKAIGLLLQRQTYHIYTRIAHFCSYSRERVLEPAALHSLRKRSRGDEVREDAHVLGSVHLRAHVGGLQDAEVTSSHCLSSSILSSCLRQLLRRWKPENHEVLLFVLYLSKGDFVHPISSAR